MKPAPRNLLLSMIAVLVMATTATSTLAAVIWTPSLEKSLRVRYLSDSHLDVAPSDEGVVALHYANVEEHGREPGTIFEVAYVATQSGIPMRPWKLLSRPRLYFVRNDGHRIEDYLNHPSERGYVVFTRWNDDSAQAASKPRHLKDVVVAKVESSSELETLHLAVEGRSSFASPLFLTGVVQDFNDGSNAPWWNWSMKSVFAHASPQNIRGGKWVASAILDDKGSLITGSFSPRELELNSAEANEVRQGGWEIQTDVQRSLSNLFYSDPEVRRRHENRKRSILLRKKRPLENEPEGYQLAGHHLQPKKVSWIEADTVDHARGEFAKANYRHRLIIHFEDGARLSVIFQNNLRSLLRRPIEFRGPRFSFTNPWYPVELWLGDRFDVDNAVEKPLLEGSVIFRDLKIDPATGTISAVEAEITYVDSTEGAGDVVGYVNLKSFTPLNLPASAGFCSSWIGSQGGGLSSVTESSNQ